MKRFKPSAEDRKRFEKRRRRPKRRAFDALRRLLAIFPMQIVDMYEHIRTLTGREVTIGVRTQSIIHESRVPREERFIFVRWTDTGLSERHTEGSSRHWWNTAKDEIDLTLAILARVENEIFAEMARERDEKERAWIRTLQLGGLTLTERKIQ